MNRTYSKLCRRAVFKSISRYLSILLIVAIGAGFLGGLTATKPDMTLTADKFFDDYNLADMNIKGGLGLTDDDAEAVASVEGVKTVMPARVTDLIMSADGNKSTARIYGVPLDKADSSELLNGFELKAGRMPETVGECVAEFPSGVYSSEAPEAMLGRVFVVSDENRNYDELESTYAFTEMKIVGIVRSPMFMSLESESSTVGSGTINMIMYVLPENYALEAYTDIFLTFDDLDALNSFEDVYLDEIDRYSDIFTEMGDSRASLRYDEVTADARQTLDDARAEYNDAKAEADEKLSDVRAQLDDAKVQLDDAKKRIEDGEKELADGKAELEEKKQELEDAKVKIADGETKLADAKAQLDDADAALSDGRAEYDSAKAEYDDALQRVTDGEKELEDGKAELAQKKQELADAYQKLTDGESELADSKTEYEDKKAEYEQGLADYEEGVKKLEDARAQVAEYDDGIKQIEDANKEIDEYQKQIDEGKEKLAEAQAQYDKANEEMTPYVEQYEAGEQSLKDAAKQLEEANAKADLLRSQIVEGRKALEDYRSGLLAKYKESVSADEYQKKLAEMGSESALIKSLIPASERDKYNSDVQSLSNAEVQLGYMAPAIEDAQAQYDAGAAQLESARQSLEANRKLLNDAQEEIMAQRSVLSSSQKELDAKREQINLAQKKLDENASAVADARTQIADGETELADAKAQLDEAAPQLAEAEQKIADAEKEIADGWVEYHDGEAAISDAEKQLADGETELADAKAQLAEAEPKLADARAKIADGESELSGYRSDYNDGVKELEDAKQTVADGDTAIAEAEQKIADAETELADGKAELAEKETEYNDAETEYQTKYDEVYGELSDAEKKLNDAQAELDKMDLPEWYIFDRRDMTCYSSYGSNADKIDAIAKVFPIFLFLVAALVALTTMTRMVEEERTQIGTLKALGYSNGSITSYYLGYSISASLIGAVIGVLLGYKLLPRVISSAYSMMYTMPETLTPFYPGYMVIISFVSVACTTAATLWACIGELSEKPSILMMPKTPKAGKRIFLERIGFIWNHMKFTHKVTARNIFRYKKRFFMTIFGIAGCTALLLTGFGLRDSIGDIVYKQFNEVYKYNFSVYVKSPENITEDEIIASSLNSGEVEYYSVFEYSNLYVDFGGDYVQTYTFIAASPDDIKRVYDLHERVSGKKVDFDENSFVITEKMSEKLGISVGDTVSLRNSDGKHGEITVTGISESYIFNSIYLNASDYTRIFGEEPEYRYLVGKLADNTLEAREKFSEKLLKSGNIMQYNNNATLEDSFAEAMDKINYIVYVLIFAAGLLAVIVLYNLTNINIEERRRELATIKVLGFHEGEVAGYIFRETTFLCVFGTLAGCLLGIWLHSFVVRTAEIDVVMFGRSIYPMSYLYAFIVTMIFTVIVDLLMTVKLRRIDMVESMKAIE